MARPPGTYLAEVAEDAARGETARIYNEIRRLSAVPFVALIYRHLATHPGALESAWRTVGPLLQSGAVQRLAWRLATDAWHGAGIDLSGDVMGLDASTAVGIGRLLDAYNRANPVNLAVVSLLRDGRGHDAKTGMVEPSHHWAAPPMIAALPPIPALDALAPEVRACVEAFAKPAGRETPALVPTLYRHLAHWPGFLARVQLEVLPRLDSGAFDPAIDRFRGAMQREAAALGVRVQVVNDPALRELAPVWDRFTAVIPEMVIVGRFLSRGLAGRL